MTKWQPPADKIEDLLARFTPRQLAAGYLRAQRRFRETELTLKTVMSLYEADNAIRAGDHATACDQMGEAMRRLNDNPIINGDA